MPSLSAADPFHSPCYREGAVRAVLLASLCASLTAETASAQTNTDEQLWLNATALGTIAGDALFHAELQPRIGNDAGGLDQFIARGAVGYRASPMVSIYQGYAYVESPRDNLPRLKEDRSFQQLSLGPVQVGRGELSGRTRLEQRWRSDGDDMGLRLRHQVRYEHPLTRSDRSIAALGWVEGFVNLKDTDWGNRSGFDQLRSFAGLEFSVTGASTVEAGYMNQFVDVPNGGNTVRHVASITLLYRP